MTDKQYSNNNTDNMDQQIVLDSDRRMTSVSSQNTHTHHITNPQHTNNNNNSYAKNPTNKNQHSIHMHSGPISQNALITQRDYNLSNAAHPIACIATILFKILSLFTYLFMGLFMSNVIIFISVTVLAALDFWTVKNVTGRLLVGLRWWSYFDEKGEQIWKFQSFNKQYTPNTVDKKFFWTAQIASTGIWALFLLIKILSFSLIWGVLTGIGFGLSALNLYGYYKCRGDYINKLSILQNSNFQKIAGKLFL